MILDYSKWDALELSDDSDIEVHPNVDKRTFIRAKQNQIHTERQQRKLQIEALKHERVINETLMERLCTLVSALQSQNNHSNPTDIAFRAIMELALTKHDEDTPPPPPEGVFHTDSPPLPTYSKMLATLLDEVNRTLDERRVDKDQRYEAVVQELVVQLQKIQDLQSDLVKKLEAVEQQDSKKITSETYHVGLDSSYVSKAKQGGTSREDLKVELLNPNYNLDEDKAVDFAQIPASDYRASHEYISSHPEILQSESETDGLLLETYYAMLDRSDEGQARRYVHQGLLLQYCRMLGRDGVALFFRRIMTPGHNAHEVLGKDVTERFQKIREMARRDAKQAVEQDQLYPVGQNSSIRIQVPSVESEDMEVKKARAIFEQFTPEMRAALESGSLDEVNKVLGEMGVSEAEKMPSLLDEAGCLSIEDEMVDATTEEGKKLLRDIDFDTS
ncbi:Cdc37 N terminal kinase binding-domain-containing protein [Chaetomidium leptoderma]|uniref:Hsp90 chaperone protein kinase-targeting subunit n=1 Tax=Chaetomidium leptoderma TaxID=669021 RepID=A0AAN6VDS6_9PEZI|nr:Cdc37 N terminal kinase binding-domain-containing protein [Chaetomidium leptoderma]